MDWIDLVRNVGRRWYFWRRQRNFGLHILGRISALWEELQASQGTSVP